MSDKKLAKQIGSYALTIASAVATAVIIIHSYDAIKFHHLKQSEQIIKECNSLNLDYSYMITSNENCSVLNIKTGEPIFIEYDSAMPKKEIDIIHRAVDYYENIFKTIDEGYDFELISNDSESSKDAIISIKNRNSKLFGFGWGNANGKNRSVHRALSEKNVIAKSYICLDWDSIQESGDAYSYYVILHELAHSFGINDVYYKGSNKNTNCQYGNTIMNSSATTFYELYPNDYGLLQAMYSKEYIKQTNYENAIKVMKEKIDIYEKYFYDSLAENLKKEVQNE